MKKFVCLLLALCVVLCFTACGTNWKSTVTDYSGEVSSNGGFVVAKGAYTYFINGVETYTVDNSFGTPVKGALARVKTADIGTDSLKAEIVVPKLVYSANDIDSNGFYIFGDYVYYSTPCANKDKTGTIRSDALDYNVTKLDGSSTKTVVTRDTNDEEFRFVEVGGKIYLVIYGANTDGVNAITCYDCETGKVAGATEEVTAYVFSDDLACEYAYYTVVAHNEQRDEDESFNEVHRFKLDGSEDVVVFYGAGSYSYEEGEKDKGIGTQGVTFELIKCTAEELYLSETYVDVSVSTIKRYFGVKTADLVTDDASANYKKLTLLNKGTSEAVSVFDTASYFKGLDTIVYYSSTFGFIKYDYNNQDDVDFGRTALMTNVDDIKELASYTFDFYQDGYAYFYDGNNYYHRINVDALIAGEDAAVEQITCNALTNSSTFFRAEVIGDYIFAVADYTPYYNYVYAIDMTKTYEAIKDLDATELSDYISENCSFTYKANIENFNKTSRLAVVADADADALETYIENTFPDED